MRAAGLARLLDAQSSPRLLAAAPRVGGDPGVALRALLRANASMTASRSRPDASRPPALEALDLLARPRIEGRVGGIPQFTGASAWMVAAIFLAWRPDREDAFRRPPLATKPLLAPAAYEASERRLLLVGAPPAFPGCSLERDESLGVLPTLAALTEQGGAASGAALAAWQGDRLLRFRCDDGATPWIHAARLASPEAAAAFAAALDGLLPPSLARPIGSARSGRSVAAWSGLPGAAVRDFADGLAEAELRDLAQLEP